MTVANKLITADEYWEMGIDAPTELVRGEIVEMTRPGALHGKVAGRIAQALLNHVQAHALGEVLINDAGFLLARNPDTLRGPDVAFVSQSRLERIPITQKHYPEAPDLAVEVLSPSDRAGEVHAKISDYFEAGCLMVVTIDPERRVAMVYTADNQTQQVSIGQTIDFSPVIPGLSVDLATIV